MSKVSLKHVYKVYEGGVRAVTDFDLDIDDKEFIVFVGPSGCGKSTTLRMIAGLENITSGQLFIDDRLMNDVESKDRDIAMVFQSYALYPHMTVYQNMAFGLKIRKLDPKEIEKRVKKAAEILEIEDLLTRKPKALSGGQRQRVALGRAIVREPKVFLLDEPLSNLDAKLRVQMRSEITKLHKRLQTTFIYVTHDQTEAMTMGDRIVVMKQGFVQQVDTPINLYENPANLFVATFLGSPQMNILEGNLEEKDGTLHFNIKDNPQSVAFSDQKALELADRSYVGKPVLLGIRPEHISISDSGLKGSVEVVEHLGDESIVYVKIPGREADVVVKLTNGANFQIKQEVYLTFNMEKAHLFDKDSTLSIMGMPEENRFLCRLNEKEAVFGDNSFAFSADYASRFFLLDPRPEQAYICFKGRKVHLEEPSGRYMALKAKIAFVDRKTDAANVFANIQGLSQYLSFPAKADVALEKGQEVSLYIEEKDIQFRDEDLNLLTSREIIIQNRTEAEFKTKGDKTSIFIGKNKIVLPDQKVPDGKHEIEIDEKLVHPVFSRKAAKALEIKAVKEDKSRLLPVSAYDEEQLGKMNAVFVQISGFDHYATFLIPASFSVYKAPKFSLYLEDGAIRIIK